MNFCLCFTWKCTFQYCFLNWNLNVFTVLQLISTKLSKRFFFKFHIDRFIPQDLLIWFIEQKQFLIEQSCKSRWTHLRAEIGYTKYCWCLDSQIIISPSAGQSAHNFKNLSFLTLAGNILKVHLVAIRTPIRFFLPICDSFVLFFFLLVIS